MVTSAVRQLCPAGGANCWRRHLGFRILWLEKQQCPRSWVLGKQYTLQETTECSTQKNPLPSLLTVSPELSIHKTSHCPLWLRRNNQRDHLHFADHAMESRFVTERHKMISGTLVNLVSSLRVHQCGIIPCEFIQRTQ